MGRSGVLDWAVFVDKWPWSTALSGVGSSTNVTIARQSA